MKQTETMAISIRPIIKEHLKELAAESQMSMSAYIGKLIEDKYTESKLQKSE